MLKQLKFINNQLLVCGFCASFFLLSGCSLVPKNSIEESPAHYPVKEVVRDDVAYAIDIYDPWEGFNRGMYRFNAWFDRYIFLPVVAGYAYVTPTMVENVVSNSLNNLFELNNLGNAILQLKPKATVETVERIAINSTIGIAGAMDVASKFGIYEHEEDFGQTLGHYGVGNGPYLVLPLLGPSSLRDATGNVVDSLAFAAVDPLNLDDHSQREIAFHLLNAVDRRYRIPFRYYDSGSPFEYEITRLLYMRKRDLDIAR